MSLPDTKSDTKVIDHGLSPGEADPTAVRQQLERLLGDPLFRNSRRYPKLLQFVVEHTLSHSGSDLKERTLGVDVFGRIPDYDTAVDPVVRITAAEVRRRLTQYYSAPGREDEIRIDLPIGSYVPEFRVPIHSELDGGVGPATALLGATPEHRPAVRGISRRKRVYAGLAIACAAGVLLWWATRASNRVLDAFWNPVLGKSESVLLSVGQRDETVLSTPTAPAPATSAITLSQLYYLGSQNVALPDVVALTRLGALMQSRHIRYNIRGANQTNLSDFRDNPVVLVGAFTNDWNMRLNKQIRFSFERQNSVYMIRDRQSPGKVKWSVDYNTPYLKLGIDYALVSRVIDPASERLVVAIGGLGGYGTEAASEFLTDPAHLKRLAAMAPRDWERKNLQVVLSTRVINGSSGPPEIVTAEFW